MSGGNWPNVNPNHLVEMIVGDVLLLSCNLIRLYHFILLHRSGNLCSPFEYDQKGVFPIWVFLSSCWFLFFFWIFLNIFYKNGEMKWLWIIEKHNLIMSWNIHFYQIKNAPKESVHTFIVWLLSFFLLLVIWLIGWVAFAFRVWSLRVGCIGFFHIRFISFAVCSSVYLGLNVFGVFKMFHTFATFILCVYSLLFTWFSFHIKGVDLSFKHRKEQIKWIAIINIYIHFQLESVWSVLVWRCRTANGNLYESN